MSKKLSNSKMLPLVCSANHSTPVADELTTESQFRNMPSRWQDWDKQALQMHILNIALCLQLFLLTCCLSTKNLPLGPRGKQQTSILVHAESRLGLQNTPIWWEMSQPPCARASGIWIHHLNLGNRKDREDPCALDPIWGFKTINQPFQVFKHMHCARQGLHNITWCLQASG